MSIASRIRSAAETWPNEDTYDLALRLMEEGVSDDELHWLLSAQLTTEQGRHRGRVTARLRNIPLTVADDVKRKSGKMRDPRAQRVVDDFLETKIRVFGKTKAMRELTADDCTEAARLRRAMADGIIRSSQEFSRAAYILQSSKASVLGDLTPAQLREAFDG